MGRHVIVTMVAVLLAAAAMTSCLLGGGDDGGNMRDCEYMGRTYAHGERFPAGDGCNGCSCDDGQVACTLIACLDGGMPDAPTACTPNGTCTTGPACGLTCCAQGERCENGVCRCGPNPACGAGDTCEAAGPIGPDGCGAVCCGASGPCPQ